jgi:hypothetical protein
VATVVSPQVPVRTIALFLFCVGGADTPEKNLPL